jgi:hypothetical protein
VAFFRGRVRRALVGSASKITGREQSAYAKRLQEAWQTRALDYYDKIGEIRFSSHFYARMLARVNFFPATLKDDGSTDQITSGEPVDLLNAIQDPGGGRSRLQYDYGRLMFVTGEGVLFGSDNTEKGWRFLWREEMKFRDDGTAVRLDANGRETKDVGTGYRFWTPHPKHSDAPDSPIRAILDIAEELIILTASVRATATTRLTNGILALPTEISPNSMIEPGEEENPDANPFLQEIMDHIQAQIENPYSPESKVPFILEGAYEYIDRLKWVQLHDPQNDYLERDLRIEAVKRMALGLDFPPEVLLGMTDANHWTAAQVQQEMWRAHGASIAEQFGDDLCAAYLRPALRDANFPDPEQVVIGYDDSQVVISPDRTTDADEAADRGMISFAGYRKLKGIDESLAPEKDEQDYWLALRTRNLAALGFAPAPPTGPPADPPQNGNPQAPPPEPANGRVVSRQEARTASIMGAATLALRQCRARAGARLRTAAARKASGCDECGQKTTGIPDSVVAAALGPDLLEELGKRDPLTLVKGGTDDFKDVLAEWGVGHGDAEAICTRIEVYAAKTLFEHDQPDLPPGFAAVVEQSLEVADALFPR